MLKRASDVALANLAECAPSKTLPNHRRRIDDSKVFGAGCEKLVHGSLDRISLPEGGVRENKWQIRRNSILFDAVDNVRFRSTGRAP